MLKCSRFSTRERVTPHVLRAAAEASVRAFQFKASRPLARAGAGVSGAAFANSCILNPQPSHHRKTMMVLRPAVLAAERDPAPGELGSRRRGGRVGVRYIGAGGSADLDGAGSGGAGR